MDEAVARCNAYLDAGADGIMMHSRREDGKEIMDFLNSIRILALAVL